MKNLAFASALFFCLVIVFAGCGKDKNKDINKTTVVQDADDLDGSGTQTVARPRSWEQTYEGEAVVDMPSAPVADAGGGDVQDELSALLGEDTGGGSSSADDSVEMTVGGEVTLPFELTLRSEDVASGKVTGEIDWTSLGAINEVEGEVGPGRIAFEETAVITDGRETGCRYELEPDTSQPRGWLKGTVDCSMGPGGEGTITMSITDMASSGGSEKAIDFGSGDTGDLEDEDIEELDEDADDADDSSVDSSALDALLGGGGSSAPEEKPQKQESDAGAALDALLGGGSATDKKPVPEKKKEKAPPPKAEPQKSDDSSGGDEDETLNELLDMIDKTKVD